MSAAVKACMWRRNRKSSWPPSSTQLGSLRAFAQGSPEALGALRVASPEPAAVALEYYLSWHVSWLAAAHKRAR